MKKYLYQLVQKFRKKSITTCGCDVRIGKNCDLRGNIFVGNHVVIGEQCRLVSTKARIMIGNNVVFGPEVTIYSGDHRFDILGEYLIDVKDDMKTADNDRDVIIENDVWIGTQAIILKGVTLGHGSIVGAGAIVTKSIPPYSIYTGCPLPHLRPRFTEEEIVEHERLLREKEKKNV